MPLSKTKQKQILKLADKRTPEEIARDLNVPAEEVLALTGKNAAEGKSPEESETGFVPFIILLSLVFFVPFLISDRIGYSSVLPKSVFIQTGAALLLAAWFFEGWRRGRLLIVRCRLCWPLAGFLVWSLLTLVWALDRYNGIVQWAQWAACGLVFFAALQILGSGRRVRAVLCAAAVSAALISVLGIGQYLLEWKRIGQVAAPAATFVNKNFAAHFLVLAWPAALWLLLSSRGRMAPWGHAVPLSLILIYLFYTGTRAAWAAAAGQAVLFALFFLAERRFRGIRGRFGAPRAGAFGAALAAAFLMCNLGPDGWRWMGEVVWEKTKKVWEPAGESSVSRDPELDGLRASESFNHRLVLRINSWEMFKSHLWRGAGVNNFQAVYPASTLDGVRDEWMSVFRIRKRSHCDPLQILAEHGLAGAVFLLWALGLLIWAFARLLGKESGGENRFLGAALMTAIAGLAADSLFSFPAYRPVPVFLAAVYTAILWRLSCAGGAEDRLPADGWEIKSRKAALAGAAVFAAVFAAWAWLQYHWILADYYYHELRVADLKKNFSRVIGAGEKARRHNPWRRDVMADLAKGYYTVESEPREKRRNREKALELLSECAETFPFSTFYNFRLARAREQIAPCLENPEAEREHYAKALAILERFEPLVPLDGKLLEFQGRLLWHLGQGERCIQKFRQAAANSPDSRTVHYNYGVHAHRLNLFEEAAAAFKKAIEIKDTDGQTHFALGYTLYYNLGRKEEGITHMEKALKMGVPPDAAAKIKKVLKTRGRAASGG